MKPTKVLPTGGSGKAMPKKRINTGEPTIPSVLADQLWYKVAADSFELKDKYYLLGNDYFSQYVQVAKLSCTTTPDILGHLRFMFAQHSIPDQLLSDNDLQFSAKTFSKFQGKLGFKTLCQASIYPKQMVTVATSSGPAKEKQVPPEPSPWNALRNGHYTMWRTLHLWEDQQPSVHYPPVSPRRINWSGREIRVPEHFQE